MNPVSHDSTRPFVVVVEDEEHIAQGLLFNLEAEGYRVHHEADGNAALEYLQNTREQPAAVLMDVMLPGRDGFSIVQALRESDRYVPVLMLTARGRTEDVVQGFAAGADDYLSKPFDLSVLFARLSSLIRRMQWQRGSSNGNGNGASEHTTTVYEIAGRTVDLDALEIRSDEQTIHLTLMEADLLRYMLERPGKIIARKELLENVWHVHEDTDTRAIDNFIVRLRRYLEPEAGSPRHLLTVRGIGYRFVPAPAGVRAPAATVEV